MYQENVNNLLQARGEAKIALETMETSELEYDKKYNDGITADLSDIVYAAEHDEDIDKAVRKALNI